MLHFAALTLIGRVGTVASSGISVPFTNLVRGTVVVHLHDWTATEAHNHPTTSNDVVYRSLQLILDTVPDNDTVLDPDP